MPPLHTRRLAAESLERRDYLSGTPADTLTPARDAVALDIRQALLGDRTWDDASLAELRAIARHDPTYAALERLVDAWEGQHNTRDTLVARQDFFASDLADVRTDLQADRTKTADQQAVVASIAGQLQEAIQARSTLAAILASLDTKLTNLTKQQTELQTTLAAEQMKITSDEAQLSQVTTVQTQEQALVVTSQNKITTLKQQIALLDGQKSKKYVTQRQALEQSLAAEQSLLLTEQQTLASINSQLQTLTTTLSQERQTLATDQQRQQQLTADVSATTQTRTQTSAALTGAQSNATTLEQQQSQAQQVLDTALLEVTSEETQETAEEAALAETLGTITAVTQDLTAMRASIDQAIAEVLEETTLHTDRPTLASGTREAADVWAVSLPEYGGSVSVRSWQGTSSIASTVSPASAADMHRALVTQTISASEVDATTILSQSLSMPSGLSAQTLRTAFSASSPTLGSVTIRANLPSWSGYGDKPTAFAYEQGGLVLSSSAGSGLSGLGPIWVASDLSLSFNSGPQYVRWIDVERFRGSEGTTLQILDAQGGTRTVDVGNGGQIPVDAVISSFTLKNPSSATTFGIRSINTDQPSAAIQATTDGLKCDGSLTALDLTHAAAPVQIVDAKVTADRISDHITASVYNGEKLIETLDVPSDGSLHVANDNGITSILLTSSIPGSSVYVSSLEVTQAHGGAPIPASLTTQGNDLVARLNAPKWESGQLYDYVRVGSNSNVAFPSPGDTINVVDNARICLRNPPPTNAYARHEVRSQGNTVRIYGLYYINETGLHPIPQEYWQLIAPNAAVTFPGCPANLVFWVIGNAKISIATNVETAQTYTEALPNLGMDLSSEVLVTQANGPAEGWCDMPAAVPSALYRGGGTFNALFAVRNGGSGSGDIHAIVHVGSTGTAADPVVKEFTGTMPGMSQRALSVNVTANVGELVSIEVLGPDGAQTTCSRRVIETYSMDDILEAANKQRAAEGQAPITMDQYVAQNVMVRWETMQEKIARAIHSYPTLAAWRSIVDPSVTIPGGTTTIAASPDMHFDYDQSFGILTRNDVAMGAMFDSPSSIDSSSYVPTGVRTDTAMGRSFITLVQSLLPYAEFVVRQQQQGQPSGISYDTAVGTDNMKHIDVYIAVAKQMEALTGISYLKILHYANISQSCTSVASARDAIVSGLTDLFREGQYGSIFDVSQQGQLGMTGVALDKPDYSENDDHIRVRFDYASASGGYLSGNVYLLNCNGEQLGGAMLPSNFSGVNYIDIPMSAIRGELGYDTSYAALTFKVGLFEHDGDKVGLQGANRSLPFTIRLTPHPIQDLSCLPNTLENTAQRTFENAILTQLSESDFIVKSPGDWKWLIGSWFHDGSNMNAVDLNWGSGAEDQGKPVYAGVGGTIVDIGTDDWHTVTIEHTAVIGGQPHKWRSQFLHMQNVGLRQASGSIIPLAAGMEVKGSDQIGEVGDVGADGQYHLHYKAVDTLYGSSVDLRRLLLERYGMKAQAFDAGPDGDPTHTADNTQLDVSWNETEQAFVNTEYSLILDRSAQVEDVPSQQSRCNWVAWSADPAQRQRLVWKWTSTMSDPEGRFRWVRADDTSKEWNGSDWVQLTLRP